jgi:hypothetical protein
VEKYRNPLIAEAESVPLVTKRSKIIFKLLIAVERKLVGNFTTLLIKNITKNVTNWLNTLRIGERILCFYITDLVNVIVIITVIYLVQRLPCRHLILLKVRNTI